MAVNDVQSRLFKLFSNHDDWVKSWANILKRILHKKKKREKTFKNNVLKIFWLEKL